ncbi:LIM and calponin homology domains-containing protein 1-like isoform X1 [Xyrichtys novacula]|uniref:LIM and calponin homology domains-containing protein 1-like isoform X1 n=2 Tax=Xyrichtys novacula TaxID=13765 RepID=A0AAV1FFC4_XYRNO|nr:LIM and calponin homology domains-containing protein 1-like isoform X1 [Xyrichtys novacula]
MASPAADIGPSHQHHHPVTESAADSAFQEAQKWIEAVTGRCFGDKDFRGGLENGILLCELLSSIKPSLVKKINRLPTPIAGLDNLSVFLRGCEELGLKGSQLFDPGDLQDTSTRPTAKGSDCSRRLKNVLITIYWLGRAANGCTSYNGPTLDLKEFEGLLSQMRKEAEEAESPKRNIRDSGYIDCWDSERSDSLSPPRHGREDSFDSLDSFGSRSRQTPSPDVLVPRGSSDGRGSDSESDGAPHRKMPDVRKDDMLARRTSISEPKTAMPFNQYLPNKSNQSGYVPTPLRKKRNDKEEGGRKSWSTATSPVGGERPLSTPPRSCSEELFQQSTTLSANLMATSPVTTSRKQPPVKEDDTDLSGADVETQMLTLTSSKNITTLSPSDFLPVPAAMATTPTATTDAGRRKGRALGESEDLQGSWADSDPPATFSSTHSVSDDPQSMSMTDMRVDEEAMLHPHSQVRHELMHNQYNQLKEEEDHWQDDLARWKNRRRSISQDLIKKEEERKMMEQLMSGEVCISGRRKSIKTYREIVEDKERREEDLRIAYRKARTPEEASAILQRYAQRFSISEAVLERLQLPKLLDRSISADPSYPCSPFPLSLSPSPTTPDPFDMDPNGPLKYLRQQSAPVPKFTSTLEARIEEYPKDPPHQRPQIRSRSSEPPSTRGLSPKPVPLLTPKPYFQSRPPAAEPWPNKGDGLLRVNGDLGSAPTSPESQGRESPPQFQASTSETVDSSVDAPSSALTKHSPPASTVGETKGSTKAQEVPSETETASKDVREEKVTEHSSPSRPTSLPSELQKPEESFGKAGKPSVAAQEKSNPAAQQRTTAEAKQDQTKTEPSGQKIPNLVQSGGNKQSSQPVSIQTSISSSQESPKRKEDLPSLAAPGSFGHHPPRQPTAEGTEKDCRGNEKYRREQEKLKEEWEKAQREVAEEERKYHEEERRILEETVAPLTPRSSALPSPSRGELSSTSAPQDTIVRSLADWERKQELLERQSKGSAESVEWRKRENDRTSDISTADDSMKTARSSVTQSISQPETVSHNLQNGQKLHQVSAKSSTPVKKQQQPTADSSKPGRPAGDRRSVSGKKLCSSCGQPLGKGAAMIIETLSLYFHIQCFKCGVCKGQLGDTTTGTDVRIRNGLLNCHQCYIRSRSAGQPTTL